MTIVPPVVLAHLSTEATSVIVAAHSGVPYLAYVGAPIDNTHIDTYLLQRGVLGGGLDVEIYPWLIAEPSKGWMGRPGIQLRRESGPTLPTALTLHNATVDHNELTMSLVDHQLNISIDVTVLLKDAGPLVISTKIHNNSTHTISVDAARITVPVGASCGEILTLGGRHAMEAIEERQMWGRSRIALENRTGRTSHEQLGVVFAGTPHFGEQHGHVWGVHVAWSGNFEFICDSVTEAMRVIQVGELVLPQEVVLAPGDHYYMPSVVVAHSSAGINGVSHQFHNYLRSFSTHNTKRPVIANTWEAVYFNHDLNTLCQLADVAASVGIERFVLDDGWFHNRRDDTAGLGDWWVDTTVWPQGLTPLIEHVRGVGMEFGLWFEPEMVNPDSDLFRAHPDWALDGTLATPILGRNQLVLDLSREDVREYLFASIDALLSTHEISYVKWDHNRPLIGGAAHAQTLGAYALFDALTTAHPQVQFESCASGGGRIDMGIARYVDRFWTSDSIDALDRLEIQKGITKLIPLEMLGSHIGSPTCHTTGRKHALSFRGATAMFGWLGVEWNLLTLNDRDKEKLAHIIGVYKQFRDLLHSGNYIRHDHPDTTMHIHSVVAIDASEALVSVSRRHNGPTHRTAALVVSDLSPNALYNVQRIDLGTPRWALHRGLPDWVNNGTQATGAQLAHLGLTIAPLLPESTMILHITQVHS
jgi:alpha-galactosidase